MGSANFSSKKVEFLNTLILVNGRDEGFTHMRGFTFNFSKLFSHHILLRQSLAKRAGKWMEVLSFDASTVQNFHILELCLNCVVGEENYGNGRGGQGLCDNCHPDICYPIFCDICHPLSCDIYHPIFSDNCHPDICHTPKFIFNFVKLFSNLRWSCGGE